MKKIKDIIKDWMSENLGVSIVDNTPSTFASKDYVENTEVCNNCKGTGFDPVTTDVCTECGGNGIN